MENIIYQEHPILHTLSLKVIPLHLQLNSLEVTVIVIFLGLAGTIYYMADVLTPSNARFPAFE